MLKKLICENRFTKQMKGRNLQITRQKNRKRQTFEKSERSFAINSFESITPSPLSNSSATFSISNRLVGNSEMFLNSL